MKKTKIKRNRKYFAPQTENVRHICDHEGCCEKGEYRAPKDKGLKEYYWFCLPHVQEYNAKWNYYDGSDIPKEEEEPAESKRSRGRRFRFKSKVNYNFQDYSGFFSDYVTGLGTQSAPYYTKKEKDAMEVLEIEEKELDLKTLKRQYKKLVKKYHPDVNQGDKKKEDKFKSVAAAYSLLLKKLSS